MQLYGHQNQKGGGMISEKALRSAWTRSTWPEIHLTSNCTARKPATIGRLNRRNEKRRRTLIVFETHLNTRRAKQRIISLHPTIQTPTRVIIIFNSFCAFFGKTIQPHNLEVTFAVTFQNADLKQNGQSIDGSIVHSIDGHHSFIRPSFSLLSS